jgi:hypothetical protein
MCLLSRGSHKQETKKPDKTSKPIRPDFALPRCVPTEESSLQLSASKLNRYQ